jgi:DNA-binding MarR family transcriptional regulator
MPKRLPPGTIREETYKKSLQHKLDKISYFIAMKGPSNKKRLERRLKIDKPTVYKAIHELLDTKRIVVHHHEMSGMVKYYDLTRLGLMHVVLYCFEEAGEDASKIRDDVKNLFIRYPHWFTDIATIWPAIEEASHQEQEPNAMTSLEALALYGLVGLCEEEIRYDLHGGSNQYRILGSEEHAEPSSQLIFNWLASEDGEYASRWSKSTRENDVLRQVAAHTLQQRILGLKKIIQELGVGRATEKAQRFIFL